MTIRHSEPRDEELSARNFGGELAADRPVLKCIHEHAAPVAAGGFCPSCMGRRMAERAALLVDHVLPAVGYRQWVLSFEGPLAFAAERHAQLVAARAARRLHKPLLEVPAHAEARQLVLHELRQRMTGLLETRDESR